MNQNLDHNVHSCDGIALGISSSMQALIDSTPEDPTPSSGISSKTKAPRIISHSTGMPKRYRAEWQRPTDATWSSSFRKVMRAVSDGAIVALIGNRGTGKTRIAAEVMRCVAPYRGSYATAMGLFLRIRSSYSKLADENEDGIVNELSRVPLLILDEIQERGNTPWEDRLMTHVMDRRYGAVLPTIVIANLVESALIDCLGASIVSRLEEGGGIIELTGPSHRRACNR